MENESNRKYVRGGVQPDNILMEIVKALQENKLLYMVMKAAIAVKDDAAAITNATDYLNERRARGGQTA